MSNYSKIAEQFIKIGHKDLDILSQQQLILALDKIIAKNLGLHEFDRQISQEILEQTPRSDNNNIQLKTFIQVVLKAHELLKKNIGVLRQKVKLQKIYREKQVLLQQLNQFQEDLKLLTLPFKLPAPEQIPELKDYVEPPLTVTQRSLRSQHLLLKDVQSVDLIAIFFITCLWLLIDLLCAPVKNNNLNILSALAIVGIYTIKCFDKHYIRMCIIGLFLSLFQDLFWILSMLKYYWNPTNPSHRSSNLRSYYHFVGISTIILMVLRIIVLVLIYSYRSNTPDVKKIVKLYSYQLTLIGKPINNPLASWFTKKAEINGLS